MPEYEEKDCKHHGFTTYYKSPSMRYFKCQKCNTEAVARARRKAVETVKSEHGNECALCGYSTCLRALEFHHLDPSVKEHKIGSGKTRSIKKLRKECEKCVLVCANCHREIHAGLHPEYIHQ
jgi:transcription elongation factor Elf1